jgi:spore coat protein U-like protein
MGIQMDKFTRTMALLGAATALVTAAPAFAAPGSTTAKAATVPATAKAQIVDPLTLTKTADLDFGTIVKKATLGTTPETIVISTAGAVTCSGNTLCSGLTTAAAFNVTGSADQIVKVYVAASNLLSGSNQIVFTPTAVPSVTLNSSGDGNFKVGGSIPVSSGTPSGVYLGNMDVTVDYN